MWVSEPTRGGRRCIRRAAKGHQRAPLQAGPGATCRHAPASKEVRPLQRSTVRTQASVNVPVEVNLLLQHPKFIGLRLLGEASLKRMRLPLLFCGFGPLHAPDLGKRTWQSTLVHVVVLLCQRLSLGLDLRVLGRRGLSLGLDLRSQRRRERVRGNEVSFSPKQQLLQS